MFAGYAILPVYSETFQLKMFPRYAILPVYSVHTFHYRCSLGMQYYLCIVSTHATTDVPWVCNITCI